MITSIDVNKVEATRDIREAISNMKFNVDFNDVKIDKENITVIFTYTTVYEGPSASKEVGKLTIKGNINSKETKKDADEISSVWDKKHTLPLKFAEDIINLLNFECGARGTLVAYAIGLAAPIPVSRATLKEDDKPGGGG